VTRTSSPQLELNYTAQLSDRERASCRFLLRRPFFPNRLYVPRFLRAGPLPAQRGGAVSEF